MITLSDELLIGEGGERRCYSLPGDQSVCVKVIKEGLSGRLEQSLVEYDYYQLLKKRNVPFDHIPKCYGWVNTSLGRGLLYERIFSTPERHESLTLRAALKNGSVNVDEVFHMIRQLVDYLVRYNVVVSDLSMNNLIINMDATDKLYLVDGVGGRNLDWKYKLRRKLPLYARYKVKQQQPKLVDEISDELNVVI